MGVQKPSLVFLSKTKLNSVEMLGVIKYVYGFTRVAVDCSERTGGQTMFWKNNAQVTLLSMVVNHIDVAEK